MINNVIADNRAGEAGSGLQIYDSSPHMLHTTIARNQGGDGSGVHVTHSQAGHSAATLTNTILVSHSTGIRVAGTTSVTVNAVLWDSSTPITISWSTSATVVVQNQHLGDPAFAADGCHLTADSAARDKGVDSGIHDDIDGEPRLGLPDLGADEYVRHFYLPSLFKEFQ